MHNYTTLLSLVPLSLLFTLSCSTAHSKEGERLPREVSTTVVTQKVQTGSLDNALHYKGSTQPWDKVILSFKSSGRIRKLNFQEGDYVKKGARLGALKEIDYYLQAKLAKIQVKTLEPDYKRMKKLTEENALPGAEFDRFAGRLRAARTQLQQAHSMLSGTYLRSPMTGIVAKKMVAEGDMVSPSRPVGVILDLSRVKTIIQVPENELSQFKRAMPVEVFFPSLNKHLTGKVQHIAFTADAKTRAFDVTIEVINPMVDGFPLIRAGMLAEVSIARPVLKGRFLPLSAVQKDLNGKNYVFVVKKRRAHKRLVTLGTLAKGKVQITSGLQNGEEVLVAGQRFVREGSLLRIKSAPQKPKENPKNAPAPRAIGEKHQTTPTTSPPNTPQNIAKGKNVARTK